mgnify:CR=1 FL=1
MKTLFIILLILGGSQVKGQSEVEQFENFLKDSTLSPKDYIFKLFEKNDIVILGERDHRETTQYDLILEILTDERFINQIGYVYTEVGVINKNDCLNSVLKSEYSTPEKFEKSLIEVYRQLMFFPLWDKYNMYKYLKGVYNINKSLPIEKKITVGLTDCRFEWTEMNFSKYAEFYKNYISVEALNTRDSIMAYNFMKLYEKQKPINGKRKALYIQNQPHAINVEVINESIKIKTVGAHIKENYMESASIVLLNWFKYDANLFSDYSLIADGKWDAAFKLTNYNPVGFNLKNSPFGEISLDYNYDRNLIYEDVADGFIFYKPFYKFVFEVGIPNVVDEDFSDELLRRTSIYFGKGSKVSNEIIKSPEKAKKKLSNTYNNVRTVRVSEIRKLKKQLNEYF